MKPERFDAPAALAPSPSRRLFLQAGVAAGGALLLGFRLPFAGAATEAPAAFAPDAFIRIDRQGIVTLIMPQVEMGQGTYTSIPMILADELGANWEQIALETAPPNDALYGNPTFKEQMTGNSNSIRAFWLPLRKAAAGARVMLT
jgi:isoquinoline 1-oxidoreductase beta subunit